MSRRSNSMPERLSSRLLARARALPLEAWAITLIYGLSIVNGLFVVMTLAD